MDIVKELSEKIGRPNSKAEKRATSFIEEECREISHQATIQTTPSLSPLSYPLGLICLLFARGGIIAFHVAKSLFINLFALLSFYLETHSYPTITSIISKSTSLSVIALLFIRSPLLVYIILLSSPYLLFNLPVVLREMVYMALVILKEV